MSKLTDEKYECPSPQKLVVFLHGIGSNGRDLIELAPYFNEKIEKAYFVSPNAPQPYAGLTDGYQWYDLNDFNLEHLNHEIEESSFILKEYVYDKLDELSLRMQDVILIGFSQGASMAIYTALHHQLICSKVIAFSGFLPRIAYPGDYENKPDICIIHGDMDDIVPYELSLNAKSELEKLAFKIEHHRIKGMGHFINQEALDRVFEFLQK